MLRVWSTDKPLPQEDYLVGLWTMVKKLKYGGWKETIIRRPYLAFDSVLCATLQHHLPSIVPPSHHNACVYPIPWVVYRMFDYTNVLDVSEQLINFKIVYVIHLKLISCLFPYLNY